MSNKIVATCNRISYPPLKRHMFREIVYILRLTEVNSFVTMCLKQFLLFLLQVVAIMLLILHKGNFIEIISLERN